jgi:coenzyme F420 hydrogenase subunit beta
LADKIGLTLSFFCAGSPAIRGTIDLIRSRGIDPHDVTDIRYRGHGWPGNFSVHVKDREEPVIEMTYAESWAFLQKYRTWGVHLWPDGAGEHADISCGDPWYRKVIPGEPGSSLVLARTERGRAFVEEAIRDGVLVGCQIDTKKVALSQRRTFCLRKVRSEAGCLRCGCSGCRSPLPGLSPWKALVESSYKGETAICLRDHEACS